MSKSQANEYREDLENNVGLFVTDFLEGRGSLLLSHYYTVSPPPPLWGSCYFLIIPFQTFLSRLTCPAVFSLHRK